VKLSLFVRCQLPLRRFVEGNLKRNLRLAHCRSVKGWLTYAFCIGSEGYGGQVCIKSLAYLFPKARISCSVDQVSLKESG
jgi:hypothetical protein